MGIIRVIKLVLFTALIFAFHTAKADENCTANCVKKERDGDVVIYKWIDETGKTKKVFSVDVPKDAKEIIVNPLINHSDLSAANNASPPGLETDGGEYTSETSHTVYITTTEIVITVTIKIFYNSPTGGTVLYDVIVNTTRTKRAPPEQSDKD